MLMFRPSTSPKQDYRREERRNHQSRPQHKRSYSFPSRSTKSCHFLDNESLCSGWTKSESSECPGLEPIRTKSSFRQQSSKAAKEAIKRSKALNSEKYQAISSNITKKSQDENPDLKSKYHEMSSFDHSERYELEVARPRRSRSELVFNVFDYVAKDVDLTDYLQPNNLRPFGSTDNIYLPLLISHKNGSVAPETNPIYPLSSKIENLDNPKSKISKGKTKKHIRSNAMNNLRKVIKNYRRYGSIVNKHDDLNPLLMPKSTPIQVEKQREKPAMAKSTSSKSLNRFSYTAKAVEEKEEAPQTSKSTYSKSSVTIEPPPFLMKRDEMFRSVSFGDVTAGSKRSITNYRRVQPPWPAYSDHVKNMSKKTLMTYPTESVLEDIDCASDCLKQPARKLSQMRPRTASTERMKATEDKLKDNIHQGFKSNISQRRTLSMEHVRSSENVSTSTKDEPKKTKSSVYTSKTSSKTTVAQSVVTLNSNGVSLNTSHSYAKSSGRTRPFEPKPCTTPKKKNKCFLPSKVRLRPPKCITKHYEGCVKPPPCPPRADDSLCDIPKKLPVLQDADCECFEPAIPCENPKIKRLEFNFTDEPRVCPCVPTACPCPPPPRADDCAKTKEKKLVPYKPGECACIEPPPMVDVPLVRLQKRCVPEEKCYPKKPCVGVETCEDRERADDCLKEVPKQLPILKIGDCQCIEPPIPDINPKLRRLKMEFEDPPPKICPCEPCECPDAPVRADECVEEKVKKLTVLKPKPCACVEPPPMIDVPLKRLKKKCIPKDVCWPVRECPVETCADQFRADMCLEEKPKKLPKIKDTDCECFEPLIPCENPRLKRLEMKFEDEPRVCPCVPTACPCPPPPRADEFAKDKKKKLVPYIPGECACIEPPPMVDVPLVRLQKRCVPDEKCYPKKPCVVEETCEDRERADDCLEDRPRKLRPLHAKPCPCVDFKMKEGPKLKRLTICAPDPPRICPVKFCQPPEDKCFRADDCNPQKFKKLSPIKPGECPCIEHRMVDAKPIPRLKCVEPEECLEADPCLEFPRADWGCWEYLQDAEGVEKYDKCKKNKDMNYKQKRKFNTDSRNSLSTDNRSQVIANRSNKRDLTIEPTNKAPKVDNLAAPKYASDDTKANLLQNKPDSRKPKVSHDTKCSTLSGDMGSDNLKSTTIIRPERDDKKHVSIPNNLGRNNSLPTLFFLKELEQMSDSSKLRPKENKVNKLSSILAKVTPAPSKANSCLVGSNIRNLSTVVTNPKKGSTSCPGTAPLSSKGGDRDKTAPDCDVMNKPEKKPCPTLNKCVERPMVLKNCPKKEERSCTRERVPVCCEKKTAPNPAFSECMDEEVKPFSNTSQWTCERKEYGFEPHSKPPHEPLDSAKNKKRFSTSAIHSRGGENEVVNYFLARYSKTNSKRSIANIYDGPVKNAGGCEGRSERDCPTLDDTASVVTESQTVGKDFESAEDKEPKLLNHKSNLTVGGANCRKMSTKNTGNI